MFLSYLLDAICSRCAESCRKELEALKREAAQNGVHDCDAALQVLTQLEGENATSLSDAAKYVEARLQMDSHNGLLVHKAAFPLHLPGNAGIHLHKRATDAAEKRRLEKYLDAATVKLGILPGNHWQASSPEFAAGLAELRTNVIVRYQGSVELMVFKRKQILLEKARNDSGKNAKKIEKRLQAARAHIQQVLAVVATWTVYGTDALPTMVSDAHLKEVLDGKFPWRQISAGSNGDLPAQQHYGMRYRTALCQLKRTDKEDGILSNEIVRLINCLEEDIY